MIKREIEISGKKVPFRSSATIPRLYRAKFKRDIFKDLSKLEKSYRGKTENGEELQIEDLEIFENVAYSTESKVPPPQCGMGLRPPSRSRLKRQRIRSKGSWIRSAASSPA